jgi:hypothetical protein
VNVVAERLAAEATLSGSIQRVQLVRPAGAPRPQPAV